MSKYLNDNNKRKILAKLLGFNKEEITIEEVRGIIARILKPNHPSPITQMFRILRETGYLKKSQSFTYTIHVTEEDISALYE